ncbi:hypothetical protein QBC46DRAFT_395868 [Diplogelasinospora grovesii]|uniref:Allergen Asp f 4 n=1 Tax=Diplogelasinospora grovesii TaxID=303347 RepID=A0AAN6S0M9_9PEZI|nr:hypothetical protein QBC46DRAFT_395868 [Diplogelasinospora grovesii]
MQLTSFLLVTGAAVAAAMPSGHAHLHRQAHEKRDPVFVKADHPKIQLPTTTAQPTTTAAPVATSTTASQVSANAAASSSSSSSQYIAFCGGSGSSKRATNAQIMYTGNLGTANGCSWNSNMMTVDASIADMYDYVQTYTNVASEPYQVICANKMGLDGGLNGLFKIATQTPLIFTLQPGESQVVVSAANTQGACVFAPSAVPTTTYGQYAGAWMEFDTENSSNGGWSGADCSSLVAQAFGLTVPGCQVCGHGTCSTIYPGGQGENAYTKGLEAADGIGLNIAPGKVNMTIKVGYSG